MRPFRWMSLAFATSLGGCSLYPIPDDVSFFRTEDIVRHGKCEIRRAILDHLENKRIIAADASANDIEQRIAVAKKKSKKLLDSNERKLLRLADAAVAYSYDFNITETKRAGADAGFRLPGPTNLLDVGGVASLDLTRFGSRAFGTEDNWGELITNEKLCEGLAPRSGNIVHPLTGSIGVGRVVETFLDIDDQGGVKDTFVDTLTFTTVAGGGANASFKLDSVPTQFRPVTATATLGASRTDVHKMTVSLAFANPPSGGISGITRFDGDLNAPFTRPPDWRARYNLCVQDARTRENAFRILRLEAPEVYCVRYADAFSPRIRVLVEGGRGVTIQNVAPTLPNAPSIVQGLPSSNTTQKGRELLPSPKGRYILQGRPDAPI